MPANDRRDLIRRLKVKGSICCVSQDITLCKNICDFRANLTYQGATTISSKYDKGLQTLLRNSSIFSTRVTLVIAFCFLTSQPHTGSYHLCNGCSCKTCLCYKQNWTSQFLQFDLVFIHTTEQMLVQAGSENQRSSHAHFCDCILYC